MRTAYCFFRSDEFAFTTESDGNNLPDAGSWKPYNSVTAISVGLGGLSFELVQLEKEIIRGLTTDGFYITMTERARYRVHFVDISQHRSKTE
jgi:hypothetical protein